MKFFGIEIEKKTDVLAFAAFLLSIGSLLGQGVLLFRGPNILLDGPKQITLFFADYGQETALLNAISNQVYVNNGAPGYNDILKSEKLRLELSRLSLELKAQYSVQSARSRRDGTRLEFTNQQPWRPVLIKSGNFQDTETIFVPYPSYETDNSKQMTKNDPRLKIQTIGNNAISYPDLLRHLQNSPNIVVFLSSDTYGGQRIQTKCRPALSSKQIINELKSKLWVSLECLPPSSRFSLINQFLLRIFREA